ncbi:MAG: hypothetical protein MI741_13355 [Rhodospirillales bacterium]|nr:hypothetical protein [Rhodospirillales bacterium]
MAFKRGLPGVFLVFCLLVAGPASWAEAEPRSEPVVLTVAGNISNPNRGAVDPFLDAFFHFSDVGFERARSFGVSDLRALGMKRLSVRYPDWPRGYVFEGPLLQDVLAAAGATGTVVRVQALDGYFAEIPMEEVRKFPILLAIKRDGSFIGIGDRGPAWVVFPRDDYDELRDRDDAQWVWSAYFIAVD